MFFRRFFSGSGRKAIVHGLYTQLVAQARLPVFYTGFAVPDTIEGRFDLLALHVGLMLYRLKRVEPRQAKAALALAQSMINLMFADMDVNLRESGVSDLGVGRKVRKLAEAFYGRLQAYDAALGAPEPQAALAAALTRNLYQTLSPQPVAEALADYALTLTQALRGQPTEALLHGELTLPSP